VLGLCRVLLRHSQEAEDAVQQTFLSAYRSLLNGVEPRHPAAWLATIARNECWSRVEQRMREPLGDAQAEPESTLPDPVAAAAAKADLSEVWRAIGDLPRRQRQALLLREFSGLSYGELADALAISEPAVESLLFRARRDLRLRLKPAYRSVASLAPLSEIRDALARAIGGMPDPATSGVLAKIAAAPLVAKLAAGAAVVVVAGGTVEAVENGSFRGPAPARAQTPVRHAPRGTQAVRGRPSIVGTAAATKRKRPRTGVIRARAPGHGPAPAPVSAAAGLEPREAGDPATAPANDPAQGETPAPLPPAAASTTPAAPTSSEPPASGGGESSSTGSGSSSDEDGSEERSGSGWGDDYPGSSDDDEGSESSGSGDEDGSGSDGSGSGESGSGESESDDSEPSSDTSGSADDGGDGEGGGDDGDGADDDGEDDGI